MFTACVDWHKAMGVYVLNGLGAPDDVERLSSAVRDFARRTARAARPALLLVVEAVGVDASITWASRVTQVEPYGTRRLLCAFVSASEVARRVVNVASWDVSRHWELFAAPHVEGAVAEVERRRGDRLPQVHDLLRRAREAARASGQQTTVEWVEGGLRNDYMRECSG